MNTQWNNLVYSRLVVNGLNGARNSHLLPEPLAGRVDCSFKLRKLATACLTSDG